MIDHDFGKDIHRGAPAHALLIVNASDTTTASQAMAIASGIANGLRPAPRAARGLEGPALPVDVRVRPWYNPDLRTATFIIPGLIAIILTFTLIQFTAMAIVRERERGTLEQLQVTPVTRVELILGKIAPFVVIGVFQLTLIIALMRFLFQVPIAGSVVELYLVGLMFIAAVLGLGMLCPRSRRRRCRRCRCRSSFSCRSSSFRATSSRSTACRSSSRSSRTRSRRNTSSRSCAASCSGARALLELWEPIAWLTGFTILIIALAVARFQKTTA